MFSPAFKQATYVWASFLRFFSVSDPAFPQETARSQGGGGTDRQSKFPLPSQRRWGAKTQNFDSSQNLRHLLQVLPVLVLLSPRAAWAVVNPFSLVFVLSIFWQLAVLSMLLLPLQLNAASIWLRSREPGFRMALGVALSLGFLAALHFGVPGLRGPQPSPGIASEAYQEHCFSLGERAEELGLLPSDRLIDPRHPTQFAMYHLKGSCNLDPRRLLEDEGHRRELEGEAGRLLLLGESGWVLGSLHRELKERSAQSQRWQVLEAGSLFFSHGAQFPDSI